MVSVDIQEKLTKFDAAVSDLNAAIGADKDADNALAIATESKSTAAADRQQKYQVALAARDELKAAIDAVVS